MRKKIFYFIIIAIPCLVVVYLFSVISRKEVTINNSAQSMPSKAETAVENEIKLNQDTVPEELPTKTQELLKETLIKQDVPFVVQAPFGNWRERDFQNACEEASVIMAMGWINKEKEISPAEAQKRILDIIAFENKTFGYSTDTNVADMEKIFQQYFKYTNVKTRKGAALIDIKNEILTGNLVIVPAFGRALKNPNFTKPGPVAHMLIIIGYDPIKKEFITNDPGTKNGAGFRYAEDLLFDAIWEYPSGKTDPPLPLPGKMQKAMISISK